MALLSVITGAAAAMICAGIALAALGTWLLWGSRLRHTGTGSEKPLGATLPFLGPVSEPTRFLTALGALIVGYHLVIWAFSPDLTPIQFPRSRWWAPVAVALLAIVLSVAMDRMDVFRRRGS